MTIDEQISYLRSIYKGFSKHVLYDTDNKGNEFCELIYPNEKHPDMPLAVAIYEEGCLISVGKVSNVTGDYPIPCRAAASAIQDILEDRIVFVLGYREEDDTFSEAPFFSEFFVLTGKEDDTSAVFDKLIAKLETPVSGFRRKLTKLKGRFLVINFSGSEHRIMIR